MGPKLKYTFWWYLIEIKCDLFVCVFSPRVWLLTALVFFTYNIINIHVLSRTRLSCHWWSDDILTCFFLKGFPSLVTGAHTWFYITPAANFICRMMKNPPCTDRYMEFQGYHGKCVHRPLPWDNLILKVCLDWYQHFHWIIRSKKRKLRQRTMLDFQDIEQNISILNELSKFLVQRSNSQNAPIFIENGLKLFSLTWYTKL